MRIDVAKVLLIGSLQAKKRLFEACQNASLAQFCSPQEVTLPLDSHWSALTQALRFLKKRRTKSAVAGQGPIEGEDRFASLEEAASFANKVCHLVQREQELRAKKRELEKEMDYLRVFGEFRLASLDQLVERSHLTRHFVFYHERSEAFIEEELGPQAILYPVHQSDGLTYALLFAPSDLAWPKDLERFDLRRDLHALRAELSHVTSTLTQIYGELDESDAAYGELSEMVITLYNRRLRKEAHLHTQSLTQGTFYVTAWVAKSNLERLEEITATDQVYWEVIAPEEGETVPTHLENEGMARVGQDLVEVYDTPSTQDADPSLWVLCSFALFFAMIIGDGGYGLLFLLGAFWMRHKIADLKQAFVHRFSQLFTLLAGSCLIWGILTHSFFGIEFGYDHPLRRISLLHQLSLQKLSYHLVHAQEGDAVGQEILKELSFAAPSTTMQALDVAKLSLDQNGRDLLGKLGNEVLTELAIFIGLIHLSLSMLRTVRSQWANSGWILFMVGGYLYCASYLDAIIGPHYLLGFDPAMTSLIGGYIALAGLLLSVTLAVCQRGVSGFMELVQVIQVFSDLLSYLRLYALALAGGLLSSTFNGFIGVLPYGLGFLAAFAGHGINIILGIMGGVIHGLRLNFLEWYHYSFEGGGKSLRPLRRIEREDSIQTGP